MLEQKSRRDDDRSERDVRPRSRQDVDALADEARTSSTRFTAPLMFAAGVLIAVAVAVLIVQNRESTTVEWLGWDPTGPMWSVLVLTFVAGLVAGPLLFGAAWLVHHRQVERDRRIDELAGRGQRA